MLNAKSTFPCPATSTMPSIVSTTRDQSDYRINRTNMPPQLRSKSTIRKARRRTPPLSSKDKTFIQQVTGVFLFLGRAVDSTLLMPLSAIASEQANPTEATMQKCKQFLDYVASQEEAVLTFRASDMILAIHSDASYLSEAKARSRAGGISSCPATKIFRGATAPSSTSLRSSKQ